MATTLKSTPPQTAFAKAYKTGDLPAAVQAARVAFTEAFFSGALEDDPGGLAHLLTGDTDSPGIHGDAFDYLCTQMYAALAMGIAMGQLVSPDVFAKGNAR